MAKRRKKKKKKNMDKPEVESAPKVFKHHDIGELFVGINHRIATMENRLEGSRQETP